MKLDTNCNSDYKDTVWSNLVISILSVNSYPISKTYSLFGDMKSAGLFNPGNLAELSLDQVARALGDSGYDRGSFLTGLFSKRLSALGKFIADHGIENCKRTLSEGSADGVGCLISQINGVGRIVIRNFLYLRRITSEDSSF